MRLGCPYILDPEDYGPNALDIEWMQVNSEPSSRENVVSAGQSSLYSVRHWASNILRGKGGQETKPRPCNSPSASQVNGIIGIRVVQLGIKPAIQSTSSYPIPTGRSDIAAAHKLLDLMLYEVLDLI